MQEGVVLGKVERVLPWGARVGVHEVQVAVALREPGRGEALVVLYIYLGLAQRRDRDHAGVPVESMRIGGMQG